MPQFDKISSNRFYAISHDLKSRKYADWSSASSVRPYLVVVETIGWWYYYEHTNRLIQLDLYDGQGRVVSEFHEMGWVMNSIEIKDRPGYIAYQTTALNCRIFDPNGAEYSRWNFGTGLDGLLTGIRLLRELAQFECIEHYELHQMNTKLKLEIELISKEINQLEALINQK
jgi:hypothetical protein